jgi:hypothetical protein
MKKLLLVLLLISSGCSAKYWVGETSNQPGISAKKGAWGDAELKMTSNGDAKVDKVKFSTSQPAWGEKQIAFEMEGLVISQNPSEVVKVEGAKIAAITEAMKVQVDYLTAMWKGISDTVSEIVPVLNLLASAQIRGSSSAGFTLALPGGATVGGQSVDNAQDLANIIKSALNKAQSIPTTQPIIP